MIFIINVTNVLVCSTIVETEFDVPTANTIIIERADNFKIGTATSCVVDGTFPIHQAYAYLLTPQMKLMTKDAKRRLEAFQSLNKLRCRLQCSTTLI